MQLDEIDWQIIKILSDHYESYTAIARKINLSEGTVRQRIRKLQKSGVLRIRGLRDPNQLANQQLAVVAANVQKASMLDKKARQISMLENVLSVSIVSGRYDLMFEVLVDSNQGLARFLTEVLSNVEGISRTETFVTLKSYNKWL
jgi:Lrp/AsnC family transcriptional regulator, regulator for asnA, asnC and gidA